MRRDDKRAAILALLAGLTLFLAGCRSENSFAGKVTYQGKEVTGGSLVFAPDSEDLAPGKPITVLVEADGNYRVSRAPGRRLRVTYEAPTLPMPEGREPRPGESPPQSPFAGLVPKQDRIEVGSGQIDVELVPSTGK